MAVSIKSYQDAYEETIRKLKGNDEVIAVVVYGSIISGDIWEESDIDFLVISKETNKLEMIYSKVLNIPIHINYISKDIFVNSYNNILKGGSFHKIFFTGKLVFCSDEEIKQIHLASKFYRERDRSIRNIEILENLLKDIKYTRKYIAADKVETAYEGCVNLLVDYSRLLMNMEGHITDRGILSLAVSVNREVENLYNLLIREGKVRDRIERVVEEVDEFIGSNIDNLSKPIINFLNDKKAAYSAGEIKNSFEFSKINGDVSLILERLNNDGLIMSSTREYRTNNRIYLIDEVIYYIRSKTL